MKYDIKPRLRGFTLAETVIALGILVVLITGFLAVFGPAADSIRKTLSAEEASRLQDTLISEITTMRGESEQTRYENDSFKKAFDWVSRSYVQGATIMLYRYKGDPTQVRDDGTMTVFTDANGIAGQDFIIQSMARRVDDVLFFEDIEAIVGRVFFVKLTQLVNNDGSWEPTVDVTEPTAAIDAGKIISPYSGEDTDYTAIPDQYPEAVLAVEASFFVLPTVSLKYIENFSPEDFIRPVFKRNIPINR